MIDRIDSHPTRQDKEYDDRSGKDRRQTHTMINPEHDRRIRERRKNK